MVVPGSVDAQRTLRGVVRDELRGRGVPDAEVLLLGAGRSVRTDTSGRFEFRDVPSGTVSVAHWGPWLDSLQLPPLRADLDASSQDQDVVLSSPSFEAYHRSRCGYPPQSGEALLLGDLRVPAANGPYAVVSATWMQLVVQGRAVQREQRATVDSLPAHGGGFALCGLPQGEVLTLHVSGAQDAGPLLLVAESKLLLVDLTAAHPSPPSRRVRVLGRVLGTSDHAIEAARVELLADTAVNTRTGPDGRFDLQLVDRGSQTLLLRAVGRREAWAALHPTADSVDLGDIRLAEVPAAMAPVLVEATWWERERNEYERRRRGAAGYFVTDEMLRGIPQISSVTLAAMVPRLGAERSGNSPRPLLKLRRGFAFCSPRFFEDGLDLGRLDLPEMVQRQWDLIERAKRVEVYTASQAPPRFNDNDGCGAVVIWTR